MIGRVRELLDRPLGGDRARKQAFAGAVIAVVALAAVLWAFSSPGDNGGDQTAGGEQTDTTAAGGGRGGSGGAEPVDDQAVPLPSQLPTSAPRLPLAETSAAERVGREFAASFLRFQRRKLRAGQLAGATDQVRRKVAALPRGRGTPAARENPPRVVAVDSQVADRRSVIVTVTVARLGARYPLRMRTSRVGGGWKVTALQTEQ